MNTNSLIHHAGETKIRLVLKETQNAQWYEVQISTSNSTRDYVSVAIFGATEVVLSDERRKLITKEE
jgi:nitroimidazol reductase NimA-like FMN-containing flavoprotein (pyridoxamine 5'-phosphate oxidase superfamily)